MTFGEKIQKLRKEKGLSQEELSYQLEVSRQAISKWENDNGYPETEKIVRMSKIFNVSLDYLLAEETHKEDTSHENEKGIYVSRESASGYLMYQKNKHLKIASAVAICIASLALSFVDTEISMLIFTAVLIGGIALLISVKISDNAYRRIGKEPILLDKEVRNELATYYAERKKRYHLFIIIGTVLLASGFLLAPLIIPVEMVRFDNIIFIVGMILSGCGAFLCIYFGGVLRAYRTLLPTINN